MSQKIEGTVVLDGLIEGSVPALPDAADRLRQWVDVAASANVHFSLELDGNRFSLLADRTPVLAQLLGRDPAEAIGGALGELLKAFPPPERRGVLSTVRSTEYRPAEEVQTVYTIGPDGQIHTQQRVVEAATQAPPQPLTTREKWLMAGLGVGLALLVFAVSAVFVDYKALFGRVVDRVTPLDVEAMPVDTGPFVPYLSVTKREKDRRGEVLTLTLKRTAAFPRTDADCQGLLATPDRPLPDRMTIESLARGYVRVEYFDADGKFLGHTMERIHGLRSAETIELKLPLPPKKRLGRLALRY